MLIRWWYHPRHHVAEYPRRWQAQQTFILCVEWCMFAPRLFGYHHIGLPRGARPWVVRAGDRSTHDTARTTTEDSKGAARVWPNSLTSCNWQRNRADYIQLYTYSRVMDTTFIYRTRSVDFSRLRGVATCCGKLVLHAFGHSWHQKIW